MEEYMDRRTARTIVYKMVYATKYNDEMEYEDLLSFCAGGEEIDDESSKYIMDTYTGIIKNSETLLQQIMVFFYN